MIDPSTSSPSSGFGLLPFMPPPQRIASFLSSATEILYELGLGENVVAVSHECDHPAAVQAKPRATFTNLDIHASSGEIDRQVRELLAAGKPLYEIDVELVVRLRPDLIVTQAQCDVCAIRHEDVLAMVRREPTLAATPVVALNPQRLDDIFADVARIGEATDRAKQATEFVAVLRQRVERVRVRTAELPPARKRRTACIEWIDPPMAAGNWMPELIELAGGVQPFAHTGAHSTYTPWEQIRAFDPEAIVVVPCGFDLARAATEAPRLASLPGWNDLSAVRERRVYAVDGNALFNRSGPRIVDSLELLARLIQPELWGLPTSCDGESPWWRRL